MVDVLWNPTNIEYSSEVNYEWESNQEMINTSKIELKTTLTKKKKK